MARREGEQTKEAYVVGGAREPRGGDWKRRKGGGTPEWKELLKRGNQSERG